MPLRKIIGYIQIVVLLIYLSIALGFYGIDPFYALRRYSPLIVQIIVVYAIPILLLLQVILNVLNDRRKKSK
jgi:hypothetical protein